MVIGWPNFIQSTRPLVFSVNKVSYHLHCLGHFLHAIPVCLSACWRERGGYCFHDRDQWLGECALILQGLFSQANKCKPPCWLCCRAELSRGRLFCVPVPKLWNHQYSPWNQSIEARFVAEGRPTSRLIWREKKRRERGKKNAWHIYRVRSGTREYVQRNM